MPSRNLPQCIQPLPHRDWQSEMSRIIRSVDELLTFTGNKPGDIHDLDTIDSDFPLRVPRPYASRIQRGNPYDPLLRQVLPVTLENLSVPGYVSDPLHEVSSNIMPGIIHKYHGRVLLILAGSCAINCRYCFRRSFPYQANQNNSAEWDLALDYIRQHNDISEVILSGGEPLIHSDDRLRQLVSSIADIAHVKRLRVHTRLPIVIPQRVTSGMLDWLTSFRLQSIVVLHTNHAAEIDDEVFATLHKIKSCGVTLLNQSVLLKGVNDDLDTLKQLSERLFDAGAMPYYLHLLDKIEGAAHFDVATSRAQQLVGQLCATLPGYLVPKLVRECAGEPAKTPILALPDNDLHSTKGGF
jgi:EF-P beta-lysylation protein EpmB